MTKSAFRSKITRVLFLASVLLFALGLLFYTKETSKAAFEGLLLCARVIIPSLFPFMTVSSLVINSGAALKLGGLLKKPMSFLFNVPGCAAPVYVLGLIGGYPVGAANAIMLYKNGLCKKAEAERLLAFCNNCGPAFILGVVGTSLFGGTKAGLLLYFSHIAASLAVGLIFRFYKRRHSENDSFSPPGSHLSSPVSPPKSISRLFTLSVRSSLSSVLNVCAYIVFFSVAVKLLYLSGIIPALGYFLSAFLQPSDLPPEFSEKLISGIFEMTGGVYSIAQSNALLSSKLAAVAFMLSWAGMSVHFQVLDFMGDCNLSSAPYILGKLLHGVLSAFFVCLGTMLLPFDAEVSKTVSGQISAISNTSPLLIFLLSFTACVSVWALFFLGWRLFNFKSKKNIERRGKKSYNRH